jgi:pimeloyl-ACP methyl ester carboxylesterase
VSQRDLLLVFGPLCVGLVTVATFLVYAAVRYAPIIGRIFEEKPLFLPLRVPAEPGGEEVRFPTEDELTLCGTLFRATTSRRAGMVVFCHEYLSDRWSFQPYCEGLRELGHDVFTFDFRSHGESDCEPNYRPLQWVTDHEVRDLKAALAYLRSRPDHDAAGFGLVGVSRGGGTALIVAASAPDVWGVVSDGAFPTHGTMLAYILRWAEIYVSSQVFWKCMPLCVFNYLAWAGRVRSERRLNCRYPELEAAVRRIAPRPWLMIHGAKDAYIVPAIAEALFARAGEPKELWIVPDAKHNRCREVAPEVYRDRLASFLCRYSPRPQATTAAQAPAIDEVAFARKASAAAGPGSSASSWVGELATP